jgi:hypothetical protein
MRRLLCVDFHTNNSLIASAPIKAATIPPDPLTILHNFSGVNLKPNRMVSVCRATARFGNLAANLDAIATPAAVIAGTEAMTGVAYVTGF